MEPILISGTNGFLGSHLSQLFTKNHIKTYGIFRGVSQNSDVEKIHDDILSVQNIPDNISTILHESIIDFPDYNNYSITVFNNLI